MKYRFYVEAKNSSLETIYSDTFNSNSISSGIAELKRRMNVWNNFIDDVIIIDVSTEDEFLGSFVKENGKFHKFKWEWLY